MDSKHLKQWLDAERGRYTALAEFLGLSVGRVSQIANGEVPAMYMIAIRDFTNAEVDLESMAGTHKKFSVPIAIPPDLLTPHPATAPTPCGEKAMLAQAHGKAQEATNG